VNNNSDPVQKFFRGGAPNSNFSRLRELSEKSRARKLMLGLHVNMDNNIV